MSAPRQQPLFLERRRYRLRRIMDAAHLLPVVGLILWVLPILRDPAHTPEHETAGATIYLFVVWVLLIAAAAVLSRALRPDVDETTASDGGADEKGEP